MNESKRFVNDKKKSRNHEIVTKILNNTCELNIMNSSLIHKTNNIPNATVINGKKDNSLADILNNFCSGNNNNNFRSR